LLEQLCARIGARLNLDGPFTVPRPGFEPLGKVIPPSVGDFPGADADEFRGCDLNRLDHQRMSPGPIRIYSRDDLRAETFDSYDYQFQGLDLEQILKLVRFTPHIPPRQPG
jgi:hypothetical protein